MTDGHEPPPSGSQQVEDPMEPATSERLLVAGSAAGGFSGALAAVFAGLCCIGPSSVALLGAGGAVAAARLTPYRPLFLLASIAFLAFGFWRAYGRRVTINGQSCPVRMGKPARAILWISGAVWLVAPLLPSG